MGVYSFVESRLVMSLMNGGFIGRYFKTRDGG